MIYIGMDVSSKEFVIHAIDQRQQKVFEAIKNKLISKALKLDLNYFQKVYPLLDRLVKRDFTNHQLAIVLKNIFFKGNFKQQKIILDDFFVNPEDSNNYDGLWVLVPEKKDYNQIHKYIDCIITDKDYCDKLKPKREK